MTSAPPFDVRVHAVHQETPGVKIYDLRALSGTTLPPFAPGAHIDLHLPSGLVRSYSLLNNDGGRYLIGVGLDANSRGGSAWLHESLTPGGTLTIDAPQNVFPLEEAAPSSILVAGGIGITPIWSMVQRLDALHRSWDLHYAVRQRDHAALLPAVSALAAASTTGSCHVYASDETGHPRLVISSLFEASEPGTHFYCCGPERMISDFERSAISLPASQRHVERFGTAEPVQPTGAFQVVLARSRTEVPVLEGQSILEALRAAGIDAPASCEQGICGTCETRVLEGMPDHKDQVLTDQEKSANDVMMICCSGSHTARLVLDI